MHVARSTADQYYYFLKAIHECCLYVFPADLTSLEHDDVKVTTLQAPSDISL